MDCINGISILTPQKLILHFHQNWLNYVKNYHFGRIIDYLEGMVGEMGD